MKDKDDSNLFMFKKTTEDKEGEEGIDFAGTPYIIHPFIPVAKTAPTNDTDPEDYLNSRMLGMNEDMTLPFSFSTSSTKKIPETLRQSGKKIFETNAAFWKNPPQILEATKVKKGQHRVRFKKNEDSHPPLLDMPERKKIEYIAHQKKNDRYAGLPIHSKIEQTLVVKRRKQVDLFSEVFLPIQHIVHTIGFGGMSLFFLYAGIIILNGYVFSTIVVGSIFYKYYSSMLEYMYLKMYPCTAFPPADSIQCHTQNPTERILQEVRRYIRKQAILSLMLAIGLCIGWKLFYAPSI